MIRPPHILHAIDCRCDRCRPQTLSDECRDGAVMLAAGAIGALLCIGAILFVT